MDWYDEVAAALRADGIPAHVWHTGGGCMAVAVEYDNGQGGHALLTGEDIGGDVWLGFYAEDGGSGEEGLPFGFFDSTEPKAVAGWAVPLLRGAGVFK